MMNLVELFYIYYATVLSISGHVMQLLSINNLLVEMRLFHLNAQEIEGEFERVLNTVQIQSEARLRLAVRELVIHHQTIFRKVRELNQGCDFRIFYANSYICLQIVFAIFIFMKGGFILKIKYGIMLITLVLVEFIFSESGQRLQDEGEQLRLALYECNWIGKPVWFTKVLQILMIRNNNSPKLGLLNLFTLNRNNVTVVIRGAYSYFSLLNKIST
ncbi:putative odorant receptor 19b [Nilaparvata lugens]|nr:putative odorant receptor 19b [Nilaparvata lugens]